MVVAASALALAGIALLLGLSGAVPALTGALPAWGREERLGLESGAQAGRVVLVTMDYLQIRDLEGELPPSLSAMAAGGAVALMNVNTGRGISPENTHITIGAGGHAVAAGNSPAGGCSAGEKLEEGIAADQYFSRTGRVPPAGSLVYLDIARIRQMNENLDHTVLPGALGEALHSSGWRTAVLGNSDDLQGRKRQIISLAMDSEGVVDTGSVGESVLLQDREFPGGKRTDYSALLKQFGKLPGEAKFVAIDLGDLGRLQSAREYMDEAHWNELRKEAVSRSDQFIGSLLGRLDLKKDLLLLVVPTPGDDSGRKDKMTPVIMCGGNISSGLLVSPTTKRPGVIMNVDIAPTVMGFLGLPATGALTGRAVEIVPGSYGIGAATEMYRVIESVNEVRPSLQKGYVFFQLILLAVSLGFIFMKKNGKEHLKPVFMAVMAVPLAYLLVPFWPAAGAPLAALTLVLITALLAGLFLLAGRKWGLDAFMLVSVATSLVITADLLSGAPLQKVSIMSYDPVVGARFYGLGNEYMGVLIGSTLVGATSLVQHLKKNRGLATALCGTACVFIVYVIAAPQLGTNVGGTIAASSAFLVTMLLCCNIRLSWRPALAVASTVVLVVLFLTLYDSGRPVQCQSHIGRAAAQVMTGGVGEVINILNRKSEINIKLIKYTIWSRIFLASLGMLALLFYRPPGVMEAVRSKRPYLFKGLVGVITGSIVALIFNDSGVVAAATTMIFGVPPLIYLVLEQLEGISEGLV